jgi:orotate phosphoribosyltransferase
MVSDEIFRRIILDNDAIKDGHFYYTHNYHSKYFIDTNMIFQHPDFVEKVVNNLDEKLQNDEIDYVITANFQGGNILAHNIAEMHNAKVVLINRINGNVIIPSKLNIKGNVLIVDDGINTGNSLKQLLSITRNSAISISGIGIFIDRYPGDLKKDFGGLVRAVISFKKEPYNIINVYEENCSLCERYNEIMEKKAQANKEFMKMTKEEKEELMIELDRLELKSVYSDVD